MTVAELRGEERAHKARQDHFKGRPCLAANRKFLYC